MDGNDLEIDVNVPPEVNDDDLGEHLITLGKSLMDPGDSREGGKIWSRNPVEVLATVEDEITGLVDFGEGCGRIVGILGAD